MLEILVLILAIGVILIFQSFWLSLAVLSLAVIFILPGFFAIFSGAPFIPTNKKRILKMIRLGRFKKNDIVYELGCGDGRIIRKVSSLNVKKAVGYEFSIPTYIFAKIRKFLSGSTEEILYGNFWNVDFSDADAIICFLFAGPMARFEKEIWPKLKSGTRLISNEFIMPGCTPAKVDGQVYLYIKR